MKNTIKLTVSQESTIISRIVDLIKKRICGKVENIVIDSHEAELMVFCPEEAGNNGEKEINQCESFSVLGLVRDHINHILMVGTKDQNPASKIEPSQIERMCRKIVEQVLNRNYRTVPGNRIARFVYEKTQELNIKIGVLSSSVGNGLDKYFKTESWDDRTDNFSSIYRHLRDLHAAKQELSKLSDNYDMGLCEDGIYESDTGGNDSEENFIFSHNPNSQSQTYFDWDPTRESTTNNDSLGKKFDVKSIMFVEEDIAFSQAEKGLHRYLPQEIAANSDLFSQKFSWKRYPLVDRNDSANIIDHPHEYGDMMSLILRRKMTIFLFAQDRYDRKPGRCSANFIENIKKLRSEINKIKNILSCGMEDESQDIAKIPSLNNDADPQNINSSESVEDMMYRRIYTARTRNDYLSYFFDDPARLGDYAPDIESLTHKCRTMHEQIRNSIAPDMLGGDTQSNPGKSDFNKDVIGLEIFLSDPDFFKHIPSILNLGLSQAELDLVELQGSDMFPEGEILGEIQWQLYSSDEKEDDLARIKILHDRLEWVLGRKMFIYYRSHCIPRSPEVDNLLENLSSEIELLYSAIEATKARSIQSKDFGIQIINISEEMDEIKDRRYSLLKEYFYENDPESRGKIAESICKLNNSLRSRRHELNEIDNKVEIPADIHIPIPPLSAEEAQISRYVSVQIRQNEADIFLKSIPYRKHDSMSDEVQRTAQKYLAQMHVCERSLFIHYFAQRRIDAIDFRLQQGLIDVATRKKLLAERKHISFFLGLIQDTVIKNHSKVDKDEEVEQSKKPYVKKDTHKKLELRAVKMFGELEGLQTQNYYQHNDIMHGCWSTLHAVVQNFLKNLRCALREDMPHLIPKIQSDYDSLIQRELGGICLLLQQELPETYATEYTKTIIQKVEDIGERLFSKK